MSLAWPLSAVLVRGPERLAAAWFGPGLLWMRCPRNGVHSSWHNLSSHYSNRVGSAGHFVQPENLYRAFGISYTSPCCLPRFRPNTSTRATPLEECHSDGIGRKYTIAMCEQTLSSCLSPHGRLLVETSEWPDSASCCWRPCSQ